MRISDLLGPAPSFSFEFFPPKDEESAEVLRKTISDLAPLSPSYVSVTYGAGGSTRRRTVDLVKTIKSETGIEAMAHLTCVGAAREEIDEILRELENSGVQNVLALRGDPPKNSDGFVPVEGGFRYASELIEHIASKYNFCIGAACHPEKHPEALSLEADLENLKRKAENGAQFLVTQLFFDNDLFYRFRERASTVGIHVPIIAGILPILSLQQLSFVSRCGVTIPSALMSRLDAAKDNPAEIRRIGVEHAWRQTHDLLQKGVAGIHFYTFNLSRATREIWEMLKNGRHGL